MFSATEKTGEEQLIVNNGSHIPSVPLSLRVPMTDYCFNSFKVNQSKSIDGSSGSE